MPDLHYTNDRLARLYDAESGWSADRQFYLTLAGPAPQRILDLGCGTGLMCDAYTAAGHNVTGVDPAAAMLDIARQKPHGARVNWVEVAAQDFESDDRFDLIIMTGHAFQVLLHDADIATTFATARAHLARAGRFVFESRNPAIDWAGRWHDQSRTVTHEGETINIARSVLDQSAGLIRFATTYALPEGIFTSYSTLRFLSFDQISAKLTEAGLAIDALSGGWDSSPFNPLASEEMIFVAT